MKNLLFALFFFSTLFICSCNKEIPPVLEITITTRSSDNFTDASFGVSEINFFEVDEAEDVVGVSNLQRWSSADVNTKLDKSQSFLIANDDHWALELTGMKLSLTNLRLTTKAGEVYRVNVPYVDYVALSNKMHLKNEKRYSIEFVLDFEKVTISNGELIFKHEYEIIVTEL